MGSGPGLRVGLLIAVAGVAPSASAYPTYTVEPCALEVAWPHDGEVGVPTDAIPAAFDCSSRLDATFRIDDEQVPADASERHGLHEWDPGPLPPGAEVSWQIIGEDGQTTDDRTFTLGDGPAREPGFAPRFTVLASEYTPVGDIAYVFMDVQVSVVDWQPGMRARLESPEGLWQTDFLLTGPSTRLSFSPEAAEPEPEKICLLATARSASGVAGPTEVSCLPTVVEPPEDKGCQVVPLPTDGPALACALWLLGLRRRGHRPLSGRSGTGGTGRPR